MNGEVWLCLQCHLMERELKQRLNYKGKTKGTVEIVYQPCGRCGGANVVAEDCTRVWFYYDCHQYLCVSCDQAVHRELRDHVSLS